MAIVETLAPRYDVVVVGSGFGSLFFLSGHLARFPKAKVAIVERGAIVITNGS